MPLAERLAATLADGQLVHSDTHETSADRIGALAFAGRLGASLIRLRAHASAGDELTVRLLLANRLSRSKGVPRWLAQRMAGSALAEWLHSQCQTCQGSGQMRNGARVIAVCQTCEGSGVRRFRDSERAQALAIDGGRAIPPKAARHYDGLVGTCQTAYRDALRRVRAQLSEEPCN